MNVRVERFSKPIIIGSGIAGLSTALGLSGSIVMSAGAIGEGSSLLAQGGMAAAMGPSDATSLHASDTAAVGGDIVDTSVARLIADSAPNQVDWLTSLGAIFDTEDDGALTLGREAGHTKRRIVHAGGDATGAEIMRALGDTVLLRPDIELLPHTVLVDLIRSGDRIVGALTTSPDGDFVAYVAPSVVLATGGIGGVYQRSTNPGSVQGTGLAAAARQGALLADLEFVQFHPTALSAIDHPAPLVTEALRGEGANLIDEAGHRFMVDLHPDEELAPRDVVARGVWNHRRRGHAVYVDTPSAIGEAMPERFPTVFSAANALGIDARIEPLEIAPAEHYHMGGIATDSSGRTSIPGLWAVGEVAATGLHGANRLASNSLLEAAVMGRRAAEDINHTQHVNVLSDLEIPSDATSRSERTTATMLSDIQRIAWRDVGLIRNEPGLTQALSRLESTGASATDAGTVVWLIASAALKRKESRGAHFRSDYPSADPKQAHRSTLAPETADSVEPSSPLVTI